MPCKHKGRKHTPIVSEKQRGFFGAEYARRQEGLKTRTDISTEDLRRHLKEASGKRLPGSIDSLHSGLMAKRKKKKK